MEVDYAKSKDSLRYWGLVDQSHQENQAGLLHHQEEEAKKELCNFNEHLFAKAFPAVASLVLIVIYLTLFHFDAPFRLFRFGSDRLKHDLFSFFILSLRLAGPPARDNRYDNKYHEGNQSKSCNDGYILSY